MNDLAQSNPTIKDIVTADSPTLDINSNLRSSTLISVRLESTVPSAYRLVRYHHNSEPILQGQYFWNQGFNQGFEWRDIPTINLNEEVNKK